MDEKIKRALESLVAVVRQEERQRIADEAAKFRDVYNQELKDFADYLREDK